MCAKTRKELNSVQAKARKELNSVWAQARKELILCGLKQGKS